jgi:hypothetical protein
LRDTGRNPRPERTRAVMIQTPTSLRPSPGRREARAVGGIDTP